MVPLEQWVLFQAFEFGDKPRGAFIHGFSFHRHIEALQKTHARGVQDVGDLLRNRAFQGGGLGPEVL